MSRARDFHVLVRIKTHFPLTPKEAAAKLKKWIEISGHSASGFGFDFESVYDEAQITPATGEPDGS